MNAYLIAAREPLNLLVLVAALLGGIFITIWIFPAGLLAYAACVALAAQDPVLASGVQRAPRPSLSSPTFRAYLDSIERTHQEIARSVNDARGPLVNLLQPIVDQTNALVSQAYLLSDKGQQIERYLSKSNHRSLQDQIDQIDRQLSSTSDTYTVQQLQETRMALVDRRENAQALETYIGRITAQLQNIAANLDNVLAETVRLRTADVVSADSASNQVAQRLADLNSDMNTFQSVLDTALSQSGAV